MRGFKSTKLLFMLLLYNRSLGLLIDAKEHTYHCYLFNNSESKFRLVLEVHDGSTEYKYDEIPHWVQEYLLDKMP